MARNVDVWKSVDKFTIFLYVILVLLCWVSIYAASYDFDQASIFDFAERSGKQLVWIGLSFVLAWTIMLVDSRLFETYAYLIYIAFILLLIFTFIVADEVKGSRSWLTITSSIRLQPAEFAKFATALAVAKMFNGYNFKFTKPSNFFKIVGLVILPMLLIVMQKETGSALVYLSFVLMMYREGMTGLVLFGGICAIVYFILGIKFSTDVWMGAPLGESIVLALICVVLVGIVRFFAANRIVARNLSIFYIIVAAIVGILMYFNVAVPMLYVLLGVIALSILYLLGVYFSHFSSKILVAVAVTIVSVVFMFSCNAVFNQLKYHQRTRIEVLLGMKEDLRDAGYNVNQSKIAIGSGGFWGKGFLNGTQTKLKYVPEQDTDFIFCTIGEEEGFWGACMVLLLFTMLILRIMTIAERQPRAFGRVYAYCVLGIFFFHLFINVGMVIGLCPVIGIPLPFFSYGGSSLWGFTILLFILLRIDASRSEHY
ncbi:MAG: rod shape-determining protein RodA [Bacteroidaceae bacterium]|nr:rod shape-determining protein RodA [Bacteroidaceae bacterium]